MHGRMHPNYGFITVNVVCCHPYAMVYPPDTTTLSLASYLLLKYLVAKATHNICTCIYTL